MKLVGSRGLGMPGHPSAVRDKYGTPHHRKGSTMLGLTLWVLEVAYSTPRNAALTHTSQRLPALNEAHSKKGLSHGPQDNRPCGIRGICGKKDAV